MTELACDRCRDKKRRCLYPDTSETCTYCAKAGVECVRNYVRKPRAKPRRELVSQARYSLPQAELTQRQCQILRERLEQIEGLLVAQGTIGNVGTLSALPIDSSNNQQPGEKGPQDGDAQSWPLAMSKSHDLSNTDAGPDSNYRGAGQNPALYDLPPPPNAWILLQEYLSDFNEANPLFDRDYIFNLHESVYAEEGHPTTADIAAMHTTIGIAHRLRAMSPLGAPSDDELAQTFFWRASAVLPEILMHQPTLTSAQCLVGLAVILHGTANPEPAFGLLTMALRIAVDLIYFRREDPACEKECEQLKRVYWIACHMEADLNIRTGRWYTSAFPNFGISLPAPLPADRQGQIQIQERLLQAGFLLQTSQQQLPQIQQVTSPIANDLKTWRKAEAQFQADPDSLGRNLHRSDLIHTIILEAVYFNAYFALLSFQGGIGPFRGSVMTHLGKYDRLDFSACVQDARRLLKLLVHVPQGNHACMWLVVEAVVSALYVMLNGVIRSLSPESQDTDLALSTNAVSMVSGLVPFDARGELTVAARIISMLYDTAKVSCSRATVPGPLAEAWSRNDDTAKRKAFFEQLHRDCG